jgi:hypothetical protein
MTDTSERIRTGNVEPIEVYITNRRAEPLTGLTSIYVRIRRVSDGYYLDWNDDTFKNTGWTTLDQITTEVDGTNFPGLYKVTGGFDTSAITNPTTDDDYQVLTLENPEDEAVIPSPGLIRVGQWVDQIDTIWDKLPTNYIMGSAVQTDKDDEIDAILADTAAMEPLVSANLDATVSSRESETDAASRASTNQIEHDTTQAAIAALNDPTAADVADAVWDELLSEHVGADSAGQTLARLDVAVSTRAVPGDAMDLITDAVDATSLAASAVNEIVDQVWEETLADHSGTVGSTAEALFTAGGGGLTLDDIADAVWDEPLSGHIDPGSSGEAMARVDVDVSSRAIPGDAMDLVSNALDAVSLDPTAVAEIVDGVWDEALAGHTTAGSTGQAQSRLDAAISTRSAPGDDMGLVSGALDADAVATSAVAEIADGVWDELLAGHTVVGSAGEAQNRLDANISTRAIPGDAMILTVGERATLIDAVWDEPLAGHLGAGSTGKALDDAKATADPSAIADAVWDEPILGHTGAGTVGQLQARVDVAVSTRAQTGDAMDLVANAVDAAALASDAVAEIADGVWDEALAGHTGVGTTGEAQNHLDADISTRAAPGAAMDLVTDAVDAAALATSAVNEVVDQVWREQIADHSGISGSTAETLATVAAPPSAAVIADAVWDELLGGHTVVGSAGDVLARVDVDVSTRAAPGAAMDLVTDAVDAAALAASAVTEIQAAILSDATPFPGARIDAAITTRAVPGDAMDLVTDALDASSLANSGSEKIADQVWDEPIAAHTSAGSTGQELSSKTEGGEAMTLTVGERAAIADGVWDEPLAGHLGPGSTGEALSDAGATADPSLIADAVWDEPLAGHAVAGTAGEAQTTAAAAGTAAEKIDSVATVWPPATGSLLDRLANKNGSKTYDQATDSLEAIKDQIGGP